MRVDYYALWEEAQAREDEEAQAQEEAQEDATQEEEVSWYHGSWPDARKDLNCAARSCGNLHGLVLGFVLQHAWVRGLVNHTAGPYYIMGTGQGHEQGRG